MNSSIFKNEQRNFLLNIFCFFFLYNMTTFCLVREMETIVWALSTEIISVPQLCLTLLQPQWSHQLLCPWDFNCKNTGGYYL